MHYTYCVDAYPKPHLQGQLHPHALHLAAQRCSHPSCPAPAQPAGVPSPSRRPAAVPFPAPLPGHSASARQPPPPAALRAPQQRLSEGLRVRPEGHQLACSAAVRPSLPEQPVEQVQAHRVAALEQASGVQELPLSVAVRQCPCDWAAAAAAAAAACLHQLPPLRQRSPRPRRWP